MDRREVYSLRVMELFRLERTSGDPSAQAGTLKQVHQGCVQLGFEYLHRWKLAAAALGFLSQGLITSAVFQCGPFYDSAVSPAEAIISNVLCVPYITFAVLTFVWEP